MRISDRNVLIDIQAPTLVSNGAGGFTTTWTTLHSNVPAKKTTHRSDEAVQSMQTTGTAIHNFRINSGYNIKSSWRIKEDNKLMAIIGPPIEVNEGIGRRYLDITVKESA
jgi:head-tail adaptor